MLNDRNGLYLRICPGGHKKWIIRKKPAMRHMVSGNGSHSILLTVNGAAVSYKLCWALQIPETKVLVLPTEKEKNLLKT